jgi:hypothetical protein
VIGRKDDNLAHLSQGARQGCQSRGLVAVVVGDEDAWHGNQQISKSANGE